MKLFKGKPTLQELEREFNIETMRLGDLVLQMERLNKAKATCLQKLETLNKQGIATKQKIEAELKTTIARGPKEPENEIH